MTSLTLHNQAYEYYSWESLGQDTFQLAKAILNSGQKFDRIIALATGKTLADAVVAHGITWDLMSPMLLTAIGTNVIPEVKKRAEALYPKVEVTPASLELPVPEPAPEPVEPMQRTDEQEPGPPSYSSIGTQTNPMPAITAEQVEAINFESEVTPPTSDTPAKPEAAETTPVTATVLENIAEPHEVVTTALQDGEPG